MSGDTDVAAIAAIIEDDTARQILQATRTQPMSADRLSDCCGVSESTIYRRIEELRELDLIEARTKPDEDGHHYEEFSATLDRIVFNATDDGLEVEVMREESMSDRFTRLVGEM